MNIRCALFLTLVLATSATFAQERVEIKGISTKLKLHEVLSGHLHELNTNFAVRATEVTFAPGGTLGAHHHVGPGIRYVVSGELTFTQAGRKVIYKAGDIFFESGNVVHTAHNHTKQPVSLIFFEIVPANLSGPTVIPPKPY